jgi:hypothetical protein
MKAIQKMENLRAFRATCADAEIIECNGFQYKHVSMFGPKTLIWRLKSGRISTRNGHVVPLS